MEKINDAFDQLERNLRATQQHEASVYLEKLAYAGMHNTAQFWYLTAAYRLLASHPTEDAKHALDEAVSLDPEKAEDFGSLIDTMIEHTRSRPRLFKFMSRRDKKAAAALQDRFRAIQ